MKRSPSSFICLLSVVISSLATLALSGIAQADEAPKRKSGLWEINMQMEGLPNMGAIQQCIDQNTDNLMQQEGKKINGKCSVMDIKHQGDKVTMHSVCKFGESVATTEGTFQGSFDKAYKGDVQTTYNPPLHGRSSTSMNVEAKWISTCKSGQKPGDVTLPNMKGMNINEMMNDPKFKKMLQQ